VIPYGHQSIDDDDITAVVDVLRGDWLTQGPHITDFEAKLCAVTGARHAVAFANGTAALHGAAAAAGLGPGTVVATSALSFVASANCAYYVGADVEFVDIDPGTLNLEPASVPASVDALVAVHFAGLPVDLAALAHRPRVIIEDAAHALGAATADGPVGNCARSDLCCFSFHPVKAITTGEGGAVTTNDDDLADNLRRFRNHGIQPRPDVAPWYYEVVDRGFNYRMTDIQAALGASQLDRLAAFVLRRNEIAAHYREALADLPVELPPAADAPNRHAYHLFPIRVDERRRVFDGLRGAGIHVQVHYVPIHHHPIVTARGTWHLPNTDAAYEQLISLPCYPDLRDEDQHKVIDVLHDLL
jgi:UDP-4-amino-4,6-dideoxy-N-acetyl-beta-L-altrosamine transaminase